MTKTEKKKAKPGKKLATTKKTEDKSSGKGGKKKKTRKVDEESKYDPEDPFEAVLEVIQKAKKKVFSNMSDVRVRFAGTEEFHEMVGDLDGLNLDDVLQDILDTAVPVGNGKWGAWEMDIVKHLKPYSEETNPDDPEAPEYYPENAKYCTFAAFCATEYAHDSLIFYTACLQLESLEDQPKKYLKLFDEVYATFFAHNSDGAVNLDAELFSEIAEVVANHRFIPASSNAINEMFDLQHIARRMLYDLVFATQFVEENGYKKTKNRKVERYDRSPGRPEPNLDFWLHGGKKDMFKKFVKSIKGKETKNFAVDLLGLYQACRAFRKKPSRDNFNDICEEYINHDASDHRVAEVGRDVLQDIERLYNQENGLARLRC